MNQWLNIKDWLNLTSQLEDRRIILQQIVVYQDQNVQKLFSCELEGILMKEAHSESPYANTTLTSFDGGDHSMAEVYQQNKSSTAHLPNVWHDFVNWYSKPHANTD